MGYKIVLMLCYTLCFSNVAGKDPRVERLKQETSYYENGTVAKIETFNAHNERHGLYREWYSNGSKKCEGQYEYLWCADTIAVIDEKTQKCVPTVVGAYVSLQTGIWVYYDSVGHVVQSSRFWGSEQAVVYPPKDTVLVIRDDSVWVKLDDYSTYNAYMIRRNDRGKKIILQFPYYSGHNYWKFYRTRKDLLTDDTPYNSWDKPICTLIADDCCGRDYYYDFSTLEDGRYYIYYWGFSAPIHELEIVIVSE